MKVFNTGKLEIPGIQTDEMLFMALNNLLTILQPFIKKKILYNKNEIETVLINSNFNCNYVINRNKLYDILKFKYSITTLYDPCSYPGIQCKFYYNENNIQNKGICTCEKKCVPKNKKCYIVSFMIFRTGSVLIVGQCNEDVLYKIYKFISDILINEYNNISIKSTINNFEKKKKNKKKRKKKIIIYSTT